MRKWNRTAPILFAAVLIFGIFFLTGCGGNEARADELDMDDVLEIDAQIDMSTIPDGVYIGDVAVGGMTSAQAKAAIRDYVDAIAEQTVMLAANEEVLKTTVTELGFVEDVDSTVDEALHYGQTGNVLHRYKELKDLEYEERELPLVLTADEDQVREFLEENVSQLNRKAVDYGLTREGGEFVILEGETGQEVDVDESVNLIISRFSTGWQENTTIQLAVDEVEPKGSEEELALVQDVLGKFGTDYSTSSADRKTNIMTGASYIDGSLIYPGETFSVESAVTPFDEEHGYAPAPSYENGTTVDTYGGGICQVSTTLYNAVIRAELDVVERYGHSMTVSYVDPSADAAIAEGQKDFKFTNNTDAPIYISGYTDGATITFTIYGHETRPSNRSVSFESETTETTEATVEYKSSTDEFGNITKVQSAHTGKQARLWKIVTVDGVEESREVFNTTTYKMSPAIYEVGVTSSNSAAVSALYDAISSQDIDKINATIAAYTSSGSAAEETKEEPVAEEPKTESEPEPEPSNETPSTNESTEDSGDGNASEDGSDDTG